MDAPPIPFSASDLERRRLEHTLDHDLSSLSLTASTSFVSSASSLSTLPVGRAAPALRHFDHEFEYPRFGGADDTPRASKQQRNAAISFARTDTSAGGGVSPASTAGHHVSAATLGAGVFRRPGNPIGRDMTGDEFDPDRSLGRLVGELAKAMDEDRLALKPASPFVSPRMPHSPSPAPSALPNLSLTLSRNDPLPSPPHSRTVSSASSGSQRAATTAAPAPPPVQQQQARASRNPVLNETGRHNRAQEYHYPSSFKKQRPRGPNISALRRGDESADVTGLTGLLATPAKGRSFGDLGKNGGDIGSAASIPQTLATLHARLRALETENAVSRRRVRELETEVDRAREEVAASQQARDGRLREVVGEKTALEDLVASLRAHLARLAIELEENKKLVAELRLAAQQPPSPVRRHASGADVSVHDEIAALRGEVERLSREVARLNDIAQAGLAERTRAREQRSVRINALDLHDETEVERVRADIDRRAADFSTTALPSQLRQGLHTAAAAEPHLMPPSAGPPTRVASDDDHSDVERSPNPTRTVHHHHHTHFRSPATASHTSSSRRSSKQPHKEGPDSPFPSIRAQDEEEFFSPRRPAARRLTPEIAAGIPLPASRPSSRLCTAPAPRVPSNGSDTVRALLGGDGSVPPQTVLARVIHELEDDFAHYKVVYVELADQYKVLDAASAVTKRHVLAEHLKEVIDCLETKADQIAALYSLLHFEDRDGVASEATRGPRPPLKSAQDLWRGVRDCLSEDARRRLEADGLFRR